VKTRDTGPVKQDVPMQQFNHAIVYVPKQAGVSEGRFFDPTADLLDLDVVRSDDVGTTSLVIDPVSGDFSFREIPFQSPQENRFSAGFELELAADGSAKGAFSVEARGRSGSAMRVASRDAELFAQVVQRIVASAVPGAATSQVTPVEVKDLRKPAKFAARLEAPTFARPEGDTLRVKLTPFWNPRSSFALTTRRHALVLGAPFVDESRVSLTLPEGFEVKKLPASGAVEQTCLKVERSFTQSGRVVTGTSRSQITCERLTAAEYPGYRAKVDEMMRLLEDELVVGRSGPAGKKSARSASSPGKPQ
jgi:hypothetical protein